MCPTTDTFAVSEGRGAVPSEVKRGSVPSEVTAKCRHSAPAYADMQVLAALEGNDEYTQYRRQHGEKAARSTIPGQAISYRFKRDATGWRLSVSDRMMDVLVVTDRRRGAIGVGLNADHLAVAATDVSGTGLNTWRMPLVIYGKSQCQAGAFIRDAVASVVQYGRNAGKPIVIERLDFRQKKAVLEGESRKYSRVRSSFAYGKVKAYLIFRCHRQGVEVNRVSPAFCSVIGRVAPELPGLFLPPSGRLAVFAVSRVSRIDRVR